MSTDAWSRLLSDESPEFRKLYDECKNEGSVGQECRVVVCGLVNAGKSAILNGITGNLEKEYFATRAIRETLRNDELTLDGITYVDTPGIDACDSDDEEAWRGIIGADIILFVHSLRIGTLEASEVGFLKELLHRRPDLESRILIVLTWAESVEDSQMERISGIRNILETFLLSCSIHCTSITRHRKGMLESKRVLVERGGVVLLQQKIDALHRSGDWVRARETCKHRRGRRMGELIGQAIARRETQLAESRSRQTRCFDAWQAGFTALSVSMRKRFSQVPS